MSITIRVKISSIIRQCFKLFTTKPLGIVISFIHVLEVWLFIPGKLNSSCTVEQDFVFN